MSLVSSLTKSLLGSLTSGLHTIGSKHSGSPIPAISYYYRPDGESFYYRPDGVSFYLRPGSAMPEVPSDGWLLANGYWDDTGVWDDAATWNDN